MGRRRRGRDAALLVLGAAGFAVAATLADDGVSPGEEALFRGANELPLPYGAVWLPMQYGSFGTVFALAGLAACRRQRRLAIGLLLGGTSSYVLAKVAKTHTGRGRPAVELEHVIIRGKESGDLGFPSGHAAVSAALTTAATAFVPPLLRLFAAGLAGFVSFSRVHIGAHLPLDGLGGASMGVALSSAVNLLLGVEERDRPIYTYVERCGSDGSPSGRSRSTARPTSTTSSLIAARSGSERRALPNRSDRATATLRSRLRRTSPGTADSW